MKHFKVMGCLLLLTTAAYAADSTRSVTILLKIENGQYEILNAKLSRGLGLAEVATSGNAKIIVSNSTGDTLFSSWIQDPTRKHGPMPLPNEPQTGHTAFQVQTTAILLRIPFNAQSSKLQIMPLAPTANKSSMKAAIASSASTIDLEDVMSRLRMGREIK